MDASFLPFAAARASAAERQERHYSINWVHSSFVLKNVTTNFLFLNLLIKIGLNFF